VGRDLKWKAAGGMNFFSAFQSEVFRPLVTLIIPGAIALSSWLVGLFWHYPKLLALVSQNHSETGWILVLTTICAGTVLEEFGTHLESTFDERADKKTNGQHMANWYAYLRSAFLSDPIGRRYVRSVVLRLKFQFGVFFGSISAALGILWLFYLGMPCRLGLVLLLISLAFGCWALLESISTHELLAENRAELLKEIRVVR